MHASIKVFVYGDYRFLCSHHPQSAGSFLTIAILAFNKNVFSDGQASMGLDRATASEQLSYNAARPRHKLSHDSESSRSPEKIRSYSTTSVYVWMTQ